MVAFHVLCAVTIQLVHDAMLGVHRFDNRRRRHRRLGRVDDNFEVGVSDYVEEVVERRALLESVATFVLKIT